MWPPVGWVDGVGAVLVGLGTQSSGLEPTTGDKTWRTLVWDHGVWLHLEDSCVAPGTPESIFAADDRVWHGSLVGNELTWVSVHPPW